MDQNDDGSMRYIKIGMIALGVETTEFLEEEEVLTGCLHGYYLRDGYCGVVGSRRRNGWVICIGILYEL